MKKLKLFLTSIVAMFVAVVGVHAEEVGNWTTLKTCLEKAETITCTLTTDITSDGGELNIVHVKSSANITLDLAGHKLTLKDKDLLRVDDGGSLTITSSGDKKGTIDGTAVTDTPVATYAGGSLTVEKVILTKTTDDNYATLAAFGGSGKTTKLVFESTAEITGETGIGIFDNSNSAEGLTVEIKGKIDVNGFAVTTNGRINTGNNAQITIDGATLTSKETAAIYAGGKADWEISNTTITGVYGIVSRQGTVKINKGTVINTKESETETDYVGDAAEAGKTCNDGDRSGCVQLPTSVAVLVDNSEETGYADKGTVQINDGEFNVPEGKEAIIDFKNDTENKNIDVLGGTFSEDVTEYLATEDLGQSESGVVGKLHKVEITKPENGKVEAYTNAAEGEEVVVKIAADKGYEVNSITILDKDGKEVKFVSAEGGVKFTMPTSDVKVTITFKKVETPVTNTTEEENPKTGDNILMYLGLGLASVATVGLSVKKLRKSN